MAVTSSIEIQANQSLFSTFCFLSLSLSLSLLHSSLSPYTSLCLSLSPFLHLSSLSILPAAPLPGSGTSRCNFNELFFLQWRMAHLISFETVFPGRSGRELVLPLCSLAAAAAAATRPDEKKSIVQYQPNARLKT